MRDLLAALALIALFVAVGVVGPIAGGAVQNLNGVTQLIPGGPVASQEAIKELGTNGGGFYNANASHPLENPSGWTRLLHCFLILVIPFSLPASSTRWSTSAARAPQSS